MDGWESDGEEMGYVCLMRRMTNDCACDDIHRLYG
jgi:hypothetical protein